MYQSFYGFTERPFSLLPDPAFLYLGKKHSTALSLLQFSLVEQAGITVVTGEIGAGKTTLVRQILAEADDSVTVGLISNTHRSFGDLLQWILLAFDLDFQGKEKVELYRIFTDFLVNEYARGHRTVLIIDEAQNMEADTLEELRMLSNINADKDQVLQLVLVGQPQLRDTLRRPELEQFVQRVAVDYHLGTLTVDETRAYIRHRLTVAGGDENLFDDDAAKAVFYHSRGVPRLINNLCNMALVYAYAEQKQLIDVDLVQEVARDRKAGGLFSGQEQQAPEE